MEAYSDKHSNSIKEGGEGITYVLPVLLQIFSFLSFEFI